jgi:hypothetical protein
MDMISDGSGDADAVRRAFSLEPCNHVHSITMQITTVSNRVANVDPNAEADGSIRRLVTIAERNLLLHLHCTTHRSVNAVEHDEHRITSGLDDPAAMILDRRVYYLFAEPTQPFKRSCVIQTNQTAEADHVGPVAPAFPAPLAVIGGSIAPAIGAAGSADFCLS